MIRQVATDIKPGLVDNQIRFGGSKLGFVQVSNGEQSSSLQDTYTKPSLFQSESDFLLKQAQESNIQLNINGNLSEHFHGVVLGPLSEIFCKTKPFVAWCLMHDDRWLYTTTLASEGLMEVSYPTTKILEFSGTASKRGMLENLRKSYFCMLKDF